MPRKLVGTTILALTLFFAASSARADAVLLKNGRRFEGRVLRETDREVTIETHSGVLMSFERNKVDKVIREGQTAPAASPSPGAEKKPDDPTVPEGLNDDEAERLRKLQTQVRDVGRRLQDARQEKLDADRDGSSNAKQQSRLAEARSHELESEIAKLKIIRDGILRSAQLRREQSEKRAAKEAEAIRADSDLQRTKGSSSALAELATKLKTRVPQDARDPARGIYLAEAVHALVLAGEVDLESAGAQSSPDAKAQSFRAAADRFALAASWAGPQDAPPLRDRAVAALTEAHKLSGLHPLEIEKALVGLRAFRACAVLVEDRLGERRWGAELLATEAGQYRSEQADGRAAYGDDLPPASDLRSVRERRERTERRVAKDDPSSVSLVKVTRWYDLVWDASKKKWGRESPVSQLESQQLAPLLRAAQEKEDAYVAAQAEREKAAAVVATKRRATMEARWSVDAADADPTVLEKALADQRTSEKALAAADEAVAAAKAGVDERASELTALDRDLDRARKGG